MLSSPFPRLHSVDNPHERQKGEIQVIFGPMFSGKTTELLRRIRRYQLAEYRCLVVKYAMDNRYSENDVATHDRVTLPAVSAVELKNVDETICKKVDVIGIDEGQFFPDLVDFAEKMANFGKIVIVAALDGTFERKGFGNVLNLVPIAESIVKLTSVCKKCRGEAAFTYRNSSDKEVEVIGGSDKYSALCRPCYSIESLNALRKRKAFDGNQLNTDSIFAEKRKFVNEKGPCILLNLSAEENQEN